MDLSQAERYAALLDGKCNEQERKELLAELAAGGDDLEIFADAAAVLHENEEEAREAGVIPLRPPAPAPAERPRWKPPRWVQLAAAAGIVAIVAMPLLRRAEAGATGPAEVVAMLAAPSGGGTAPPAFTWSAPRGAGAGRMEDRDRVQLGARLVELELYARRGDERARTAAGQVAALLGTHPAAGELAARYRRIEASGVGTGGLDPELGERAAELGGTMAETGAWLQGARVAVARRDTAFFAAPLSREVLAGRGPGERLERIARDELGRAREALEGASPRWGLLRTATDDMLSLAART
ncbi:MAG TPA: hypothetical protein VEX86_16765 [Longimicrobium sp.]|nr:hypothetical protein [Longimicrobium sp.]